MTPQYIEIDKDNNKYYYKDKAMTILHREDGPAVEWCDGTKFWIINGLFHREDGPAIDEWVDGYKAWYLNDERLTEQEFLRRTAKETILTMDEIAAKFGIEVSKLKIQK
jgi:hypothetical protein